MIKIIQELQSERRGFRLLCIYQQDVVDDHEFIRYILLPKYLVVVKIFVGEERWGLYKYTNTPLSTEEVNTLWVSMIKKIVGTMPEELQYKFYAAHPKIENIIS